MTDLHLHSACSDGSDTPEELAAVCAAHRLYAAALTDHDTLGGTGRFVRACEAAGIRAVTGVELSTETRLGSLHMLGYGIDVRHDELNEALRLCRAGRAGRNELMVGKLRALGANITLDEVVRLAGGEVVARPHIARVLVAKGFAASCEEAFDRYLAKGRAAYADRFRLPPDKAIRLIHAAGGAAVLAHPFDYASGFETLAQKVNGLANVGLDGLETYYPGYDGSRLVDLLRLAKRHNLVATGGSDYHGLAKPGLLPGTGNGRLAVPDACFDALLRRLGR